MRRYARIRIGLLALLLATPGVGAAAVSAAAPAAAAERSDRPDASVALADILALPPALVAQWQAARTDPRAPRQRLQRLAWFVVDPAGLGVRYRDDANHSVAQTFATREANCLGYTLLFVALARADGLQAGAQEIRATLAWDRQAATLFRSSHLNAWVRLGPRRYTLDAVPDGFLLARDRARPIADRSLLAHYYNNLAVAQLARDDLAPARRLMAAVLALDPARATHWSNAGVLRRRSGDVAGATQAYREALRREPDNLEALFNSIGLARLRGDAPGEAAYRARLERAQRRDPFHQFMLALDYELAGDLPQAIEHFLRATRLQRDEPRFHAALAQAYRRAGELPQAERAAARARALARP
jgi:tetratricopeptide (TPR) repeat protein